MPRFTSDYWRARGYAAGAHDSDHVRNLSDIRPPLSGEFAGESIPEIFGSWEEATDENMDAYEQGYYEAILREVRDA